MNKLLFMMAASLCFTACQENKTTSTIETTASADSIAIAPPNPENTRDVDEMDPGNADTTNLSPEERAILNIRRQYQAISNMALTTKQFGFECDVKDSITYYLHDNNIVKVVIDWGFLGDGKSQEEYYYRDGKPFFVLKKHHNYGPGQPETIFEQRYYFENDATIRYLENDLSQPCNTSYCNLTKNSREYKALEAYRTKNFRSALCN